MIFVHLYPFLLVFLAAAEILEAFDASPPALFGTFGEFAGLRIAMIQKRILMWPTTKVFDIKEEVTWTRAAYMAGLIWPIHKL